MAFFTAVALTLFCLPVQAADVRLFNCLKGVLLLEEYNRNIQTLQPGDRIDLCNGESITIEKRLGAGESNIVCSIHERPGEVIRFPLRWDKSKSVNSTLRGEEVLKEYGVPHVRITSSKAGLWTMAERLPEDDFFTYGEFAKDKTLHSDPKIVAKLEEFAVSISAFNQIGDMHRLNVVYSRSRGQWLILDWVDYHSLWNYDYSLAHINTREKYSYHTLNPMREMFMESHELPRIEERIESAITSARKEFFSDEVRASGISFKDWIRKKYPRCKTYLEP